MAFQRRQWEAARLSEEVDLSEELDPAPFHLVKKTSLYKVHSIFSMLQLSIAYVTEGGRLIGVVALSDVRRELERSQERAHRGRVLASHVPSSKERIRKPPKKVSTVVDILTPTLEVIDPRLRAFSAEQNTMSGHSRPHSPQSSYPSRDRSKSTHAAFESDDEHAAFRDKPRTSEGALPHDELAEAVAYLRRKSLIDDRKFPKDIKKNNK
ncbi:hypothetical protein COOONC_21575 [Cooperia oncophora]